MNMVLKVMENSITCILEGAKNLIKEVLNSKKK